MFPIARQTAGPIGLTFFVDTHGWPGSAVSFKNQIFFFQNFVFNFFSRGQRQALQLVHTKVQSNPIQAPFHGNGSKIRGNGSI